MHTHTFTVIGHARFFAGASMLYVSTQISRVAVCLLPDGHPAKTYYASRVAISRGLMRQLLRPSQS